LTWTYSQQAFFQLASRSRWGGRRHFLFGEIGRLPTASMAMPQQKQIPGRMGMTEQERLIELERRMANVEKQLATLQKSEVKASFRVVDLGIGLPLR
jgi:hypothetical protein